MKTFFRPRLVAIAAFILLLTERPAHAYLDAGVGSLMAQLILAGSAGMMVLSKLWWSRLAKLVKFPRRKNKTSKPRADQAA